MENSWKVHRKAVAAWLDRIIFVVIGMTARKTPVFRECDIYIKQFKQMEKWGVTIVQIRILPFYLLEVAI